MPLPKLILNGLEKETQNAASDFPELELHHKIEVSGAMRGALKKPEIQLEKDHLVQLVFEDDTKWLCPADSLEDIYPGAITQNRDGESVFEMPTELDVQQDRGFLGKAVLKVVNIFVKKKFVGPTVKEAAEKLEGTHLGNLRGLVRVDNNFELVEAKDLKADAPFLLFIHGTNSSASGSFAELKGTPVWNYMVQTYGNNILALQHETLTKTPLQNAIDLVKQLPVNATLHIITHSRGGLVGEILSRFSGSSSPQSGFSKKEMKFFSDENRNDEVDRITVLQQLYTEKKFVVRKFIRVACPTAGTTLVSKRLDYFFNISLNLLSAIPLLGGNLAYQAMKDLLLAVIDQKNKPDVLPGLEAMKPDSPFITVLNNQSNLDNSQADPVFLGEPVVAISGNSKMKINLKALFIIASKLFFFEQNDLVVNTKSMYAGSERKQRLRYFFDEGTDVDHFHYFKNAKTNDAILRALKFTGQDQLEGFDEYFRGAGERNALLGLDGGEYATGKPSGKKPILVLLPGIMGSVLTKDDDRIWINYLRFLTGGLNQIGIKEDNISTSAIIKTSYKELGDSLSEVYDVVTFSFDWRKKMKDSARLLEDKIKELLQLDQPIKIVGHSMGGMLVRDFMVFCPGTWKTLNASPGFRLLFLGSPLGGSFRINNVMFGEDDLIDKLSKIDIVHSKRKLLEMFAAFPGLLCLLPFNKDEKNNFSDKDVWNEMKDAFGDTTWPGPNDDDLKDFGDYRDEVLLSKDVDFNNAVYIAGHDKATPCGYRIDDTIRGPELVFLSTGEGDQSVTWEMGIPQAMINAGTVYYVNYSHGALSNTRQIFAGIKDILANGKTDLLSRERPVVRGDQKVFKKPETSDFDFSEDGLVRSILSIPSSNNIVSSEPPVRVKVSHGDLKYASYPLVAGHFKNDSILYAEQRIDKLLGGLLSDHHKLNIYPGEIATYNISLSNNDIFPGALIIGLGQFDKLTSYELSRSAEQVIGKFLLMVNGSQKVNNPFPVQQRLGISSLIIGCGYGGLSIENAINAILQAVINANAKISNLRNENAKLIEEVEFVELYEERALTCMYSVRRLSKDFGGSLNIIPDSNAINNLNGRRKQMNLGQNEEWWIRITIRREENLKGGVKGLRFTISTGAAREDMGSVFTNVELIEQLLEEISTDNNWQEEKAKVVFELLIPNDFKSRLKKHGNIVWVVDQDTASFPWELLLDNSKPAQPLCINAGMVRQLITPNSRINIEPVSENEALVIGDPALDQFLPQLPGAFKEASEIVSLLNDNKFKINNQVGKTYDTIIPALVSSNYKIVHMAGHGIFNSDPEKPSGMVIGKNVYLTTAEINQMSTSPELVFVNCCFLGKTDTAAENFYQSRFKLAANMGTQLINNGVKAVIVAGWAVDDAAALAFAKKFYQCMFQGKTFGDAIKEAREYIYTNFGNKNTWGAYQAYGDPFYKLREMTRGDYQRNYVVPTQAEIDLSNLLSDLSTGDIDDAEQKLNAISQEVDKQGIRNEAITELEAMIYRALNQYEKAINKFEQLFATENATYSFRAAETYCNLKVKYLSDKIDKIESVPEELQDQFRKVIQQMESLVMFTPSAERYNLLGSAFKRKIKFYLDDDALLIKTIGQSIKNYESAFSLKSDSVYAYSNWVTLKSVLVISGNSKWGDDTAGASPGSIEKRLADLKDISIKNPKNEFWPMLWPSNISFCSWILLATEKNAVQMPPFKPIADNYIDIWMKIGTKNDKLTEIQHLDLVIMALKKLSPRHFILEPIQQFRDTLFARV